MKRKSLFAVLLAVSLFNWIGCEKEVQSALDFDSITETVTISGIAAYSTGVDTSSSNYTVVIEKPAVGRNVFVEVAYNQYDPAAAGTKIYQTVTDSVGGFSIDIPTIPNGINATLRMEEFTDYYSEYEKMENGKPVFDTRLNRYNINIALNGLKPGAFEYPEKIVYAPVEIDLKGYDETVLLKGNILLAIETSFCEGAFKAAKASDVEFEIVYNQGAADELTLTFGATTDTLGNYSIKIPAQSLKDGFVVANIKVKGIGSDAYVHYTSEDGSTVTLSGAYELQNIVGGLGVNLTDIISGMDYNLGKKYLFFTPNFNGTLTAVANPATWHDDLAGWAIGSGNFDDSYIHTVTLTGSVKLAQQTAYGKGTYAGSKQVITVAGTTAPYNADMTAVTDASGNFSIEIPVQDATVNPAGAFTVALDNYEIPYTFYQKDGKTVVLKDGAYDNAYTNIVGPEAEWYELGDFYFTYAPAAGNTPDDWSDNLVGWKKFQGYNNFASVTGSLFFAYESGYATGSFKGAYKEMAEVVVFYAAPIGTQTFAIPVATTGSFNFTIPLKDGNDQPAVIFVLNDYNTTGFVHYPTYGSASTKLLKGTYSLYNNGTEDVVVKGADAEWNVIGDFYYTFTPDVAPTTWHANLAGWFKKLKFEKSITATGSAYFAVEDSFAVGHYNAAAGEVITVSVTAPYLADLQIPVASNGSFSVNIPIKNDGDECTVAAGGAAVDVDDFVHYTTGGDKNKTRILEGKYTPMANPIKSEDAEWNELGGIYYTFTPDAAYKPDQWDNYFTYIAGWQKKAGYESKAYVTGTVMYPIETAFYKGGYTGQPYHFVKITGISNLTYVGVTDVNGDFSIPVMRQFGDDAPALAWDASAMSTDIVGKYSHFRKAGSETTVSWEGTYFKNKDISSNTAWNVLGTRYYSFTPDYMLGYDTSVPEWADYMSLAGWRVADYAEKTTITITGTIKKAIEIMDGGTYVAGWEAAKNQKATVTVAGYAGLEVITNASGVYSFTMKVEEAKDPYTITVSPQTINGTIAHHPDNTSAATTSVAGKFEDGVNIYSVPKSASGTVYAVTNNADSRASAKMYFTPTTIPTGWAAYDWTAIKDEN